MDQDMAANEEGQKTESMAMEGFEGQGKVLVPDTGLHWEPVEG